MKKAKYFLLFIIITLFFLINTNTILGQSFTSPKILNPLKTAISQPVRDLPISTEKVTGIYKTIPLLSPFKKIPVKTGKDESVQNYNGLSNSASITLNFDGVSADGWIPSDDNGDVGPHNYVQMVNARSQIWDKNGNSLAGPFDNIDFWSNLSGPWSGTNDGDPMVLYDDMADRWLVSQFALPNFPNGPFYELIAVSTTSDPTGTYYQYAYEFQNMPDYPKFGVWPDGYYMSVNSFTSGSLNWFGPLVAVFDRNAMLSGSTASCQYLQIPPTEGAMLPSDCDGEAPPAGAPNYFMASYDGNFSRNSDIAIYEFHVDWVNPENTSFSGPLLLSTPTYWWLFGIPQHGTNIRLDDLSDRPMNRLQYRNFGDHQSMVVCQSVNAGSYRAGIRWWELRKPRRHSAWEIYQEGTYAPNDGLYRWMGSIAMNSYGDIALGYSVSSSSIYPDIRFTGRLASDPLGVMTISETTIFSSSGYQTHYRWGDYTQMVPDPSDPHTFWYTNQYEPSTGAWNWHTRIAAFELDEGTPIEEIDDLIAEVQELETEGVLNHDQSNSLIVKLNAAKESINRGQTNTAIRQMQAFINEVNDFIDEGILTAEQGGKLIDDATAIIDLIQNGASMNKMNKTANSETPTNLPDAYSLNQNYPNPFNPTTTIRYALPENAHVSLIVYNLLGQQVAELVNGEVGAGYHQAVFNAGRLASGIYFYRLTTDKFTQINKMLLMK